MRLALSMPSSVPYSPRPWRTGTDGYTLAINSRLERFITVLNRKIQALQRSEEFLASQRKLMEALLSSRSRERELVELVANAFDLPTRTEIDDAHRSVHDLKREVRALRRELDELKANGAGASPTVAPLRHARGGGDGASHPN